MAFGSVALFDNHFNIAHFLKITTYLIAFIGILQDYISVIPNNKTSLDLSPKKASFRAKKVLEIGRAKFALGIKIPLAVFIVTILTASAVGTAYHTESEQLALKKDMQALIKEADRIHPILIRLYEELYSDVVLLSLTPPVQTIIESTHNRRKQNNDAAKSRLATIFSAMLKSNPNYLQIRLIGMKNDGKEIVRVDKKRSGIVTISKNILQKKKNSGYFQAMKNMREGDAYFSKIELNREHGKISLPQTSIIRGAFPIYDHCCPVNLLSQLLTHRWCLRS